MLKRTLHSSTGGLDSVIEAIDLMFKDQAREVWGALEKDRNTSVVEAAEWWLFDKIRHLV